MRNAFNKIIDIVGVWGGWGPTITIAWGLTRPKSRSDLAYALPVAFTWVFVFFSFYNPLVLHWLSVFIPFSYKLFVSYIGQVVWSIKV